MTTVRLDGRAIASLRTHPGVAARVRQVAEQIDTATPSESRIDEQTDERYRAAVIAGYERGATAESTRDALLRGLDGAR